MDMRALLVICADSDTGYRIVQLACRAGLNVIACLRPTTDPGMYQRLGAEVMRADPTKRADVAALFANLNLDDLAVASVIGGSPLMNSAGNMNVINVANEVGVQRFLLVTSIGCGDSAGAVDDFVKAFVGKALTAKTWAERALQREYDLVLLDLGLPDGDGLDICRSLRARGRGTPIIVVTAVTRSRVFGIVSK